MWEVAAFMGLAGVNLCDLRPGGIVEVSHPNDVRWLGNGYWLPQQDCKGCGAPLPQQHTSMNYRPLRCEYCRRPVGASGHE